MWVCSACVCLTLSMVLWSSLYSTCALDRLMTALSTLSRSLRYRYTYGRLTTTKRRCHPLAWGSRKCRESVLDTRGRQWNADTHTHTHIISLSSYHTHTHTHKILDLPPLAGRKCHDL